MTSCSLDAVSFQLGGDNSCNGRAGNTLRTAGNKNKNKFPFYRLPPVLLHVILLCAVSEDTSSPNDQTSDKDNITSARG